MHYMRPQHYRPVLHKAACLNLYRTLLQLTKTLPLPRALQNTTASHIHYKFHLHRNLQGQQIPLALRSAYAFETLLRSAANHDTVAVTTLREHLKSLLLARKEHLLRTQLPPRPTPPPGTPVPPTRREKVRNLQMTPLQKAARSAMARRRPPVMHAVNGFPVLHFPGRPQNESVSKTIKRLLKQQIQQVEELHEHEDENYEWASGEDVWDNMLEKEAGYKDPDVAEDGAYNWLRGSKQGRQHFHDAYEEVRKKAHEHTVKLQARIDAEAERYERQKLLTRRTRRRRERKRKALIRAMKNGRASEEDTMAWIRMLYRKPKLDWKNKRNKLC